MIEIFTGTSETSLMYHWLKIFDSAIRKRENVQIFLLKMLRWNTNISSMFLNFDPLCSQNSLLHTISCSPPLNRSRPPVN